jgi:hypothetical protein
MKTFKLTFFLAIKTLCATAQNWKSNLSILAIRFKEFIYRM